MAQKPITMEQIKQILQLHRDGVGIREISRRVALSGNTIRKYLSNLAEVIIEAPSGIDDSKLAETAYSNDKFVTIQFIYCN
jgi:hypothetical protein